MWFLEHIREAGLIGAMIVVAAYLSSTSRKDEAKKQALKAQKDAEEMTVADYQCQGCGCAKPRYRQPQIVEVRSVIEFDWLDAMLLRLGFSREVEHTVQVDYGDDGGHVYCKLCAAVARAECERRLQTFKGTRADLAVAEARAMGEFNAFGMKEAVAEATKAQRDKLAAMEKQRLIEEKRRQAATVLVVEKREEARSEA
jgi:hypothetical protein